MKPTLARPPSLLLPLLLAALLLQAVAADAGSAGQVLSQLPVQCTERLKAMSSCLHHVATLPENASATPSAACCQAFSAVLDGAGGGAACLCHLVREPSLLGSPVNASGISSLFSSCGKSDGVASSTFAEICQVSVREVEAKFPPRLASTSTAGDLTEEPRPGETEPPPVAKPPPSPAIVPTIPDDSSSSRSMELLFHGVLLFLLSLLTLNLLVQPELV